MWILFRVVLAIIGFVIRQASRRHRPKTNERREFLGKPYFEHIDESRKGIVGFKIGMPRRSPTWIYMHGETAVDRLCKRLRLAREIQTGDAAFDELVYVTSDHPHVETVLKESPALREAIRKVLEDGYRRVAFDGAMVWLERASEVAPSDDDVRLLADVHAASERLEAGLPSRLASTFLWEAFIIEGVAWSIFAFGAGAILQFWVGEQDHHLFPSQLIRPGLIIAAAIFAILVTLILFLLGGSSRGHRILVESAIILAIGLPTAGIQIVADTNRMLDDEPSTVVQRTASRCEVRKRRSRRRTYYTYHLRLANPMMPGEPELPSVIDVTDSLCRDVTEGAQVEFEIGPGRWGIPWYRRITAGGETWRAF